MEVGDILAESKCSAPKLTSPGVLYTYLPQVPSRVPHVAQSLSSTRPKNAYRTIILISQDTSRL